MRCIGAGLDGDQRPRSGLLQQPQDGQHFSIERADGHGAGEVVANAVQKALKEICIIDKDGDLLTRIDGKAHIRSFVSVVVDHADVHVHGAGVRIVGCKAGILSGVDTHEDLLNGSQSGAGYGDEVPQDLESLGRFEF